MTSADSLTAATTKFTESLPLALHQVLRTSKHARGPYSAVIAGAGNNQHRRGQDAKVRRAAERRVKTKLRQRCTCAQPACGRPARVGATRPIKKVGKRGTGPTATAATMTSYREGEKEVGGGVESIGR